MRVGKQMREVTLLPSYPVDVWAFEVKGRLYLQVLSRFGGTLHWGIVSAKGSLSKPERVMYLKSGVAATQDEERAILAGPESLLKALKEGSVSAFEHVDKAKEHRDKEFGVLTKALCL